MTRRIEQLGGEIHKAVQAAIDRGLQDPRISGLITITGVRITPDLKIAFVNVSVLPAERQKLTMHGLESASRHLRREIGSKLAVRQMPELVFKLDESLKKQAGVLEAIAKANEDLARRGAQPPAGGPEEPAAGPDA
jgi:ribosome-binding factor A